MSIEQLVRDAVQAVVHDAEPASVEHALETLRQEYERRRHDPAMLAVVEEAAAQAELDPALSLLSKVDVALDDHDREPMTLGRQYEEEAVEDWDW
jgi:hypothetical protein